MDENSIPQTIRPDTAARTAMWSPETGRSRLGMPLIYREIVRPWMRLYTIRYALTCHKPFTAKKTNTIYCSPKCGKIYRKSKNEGLKDIKRRENYVQKIVDTSLPRRQLKIVKACANCGRDFDAMKITTMFCWSSCAKVYRIREKVYEDQGKITAESIYQKVAVRELNAPFMTGRRRNDESRPPATLNDMRTSIIVDKTQYAIVREIALRECMTIKEIIYAMFELGINRYEQKHGKVHVRKPKGEKDLF